MPSDAQIAWAAGLFEGEGCVAASDRGDLGVYPHVALVSTDRDVVARFAEIVGYGHLHDKGYKYENRPAHYKPRWTWTCGAWHDIERLVEMLWPWLGVRRRARIAELVQLSEQRGLGRRRRPWVSRPWEMEAAA